MVTECVKLFKNLYCCQDQRCYGHDFVIEQNYGFDYQYHQIGIAWELWLLQHTC